MISEDLFRFRLIALHVTLNFAYRREASRLKLEKPSIHSGRHL